MKKILSMILAVVMVLSLGAFALADDPVEITFWSMWNEGEPQATVIAEAAEAYEAETGVHVNIEWRGRDLNTQIQAALDAEDAVDIFEDDYNRICNTYDLDKILDLTDMAQAAGYADHSYAVFNDQVSEWVRARVAEATGDEEAAGYLNSIVEQPQVGGIFYNRDAFEAAGIEELPTTWAELLDVCEKLKAADIAPFAQDGAYTNFSFYYHLVRYLGEDGIAELRDNGGWADNEQAVQAAQDIIDLINAGYLVDGAPDEYPSSQNKLGTGEAAMVVLANYVTAEVDSVFGPQNWGLIAYPDVEGGVNPATCYLGANSLAITSYSEHPQEAFDFIMFLVTEENDQKMADTAGQIPADPHNTCGYLPTAVDTLKNTTPMGWCTSLNTHPAWGDMKTLFTELFEGKYETGADFCAAMDALY